MASVCLQCGRPGFDLWVGKFPGEGNGNPLQYSCLERREVPWRRKRQPTPVLLPRKSHGQRSLVSMGSQRVGHDWATSLLMISGLMLVFPCRFIITVTTWFKFSPHVGFAAEVSFLRSHTWSWLSLVHLPHCSQRKLMKSAHNTHHSKV